MTDDDYGQKTVSVLLNNQETDLEVIDHPACEMSVSSFVCHHHDKFSLSDKPQACDCNRFYVLSCFT